MLGLRLRPVAETEILEELEVERDYEERRLVVLARTLFPVPFEA